MIGLEPLRWALTVALAAASAFHLVRSVRPAGTEGRPAESLHLLMGVSMIAMIWPWGGVVPVAGWVAVFAGATGWFVIRAVRSVARLIPVFFASTMAAMIWMAVTMPAHAPGHPAMSGMSGSPGPAGWIDGTLGVCLMGAALWWLAAGMRLGSVGPLPADPVAGLPPVHDFSFTLVPAAGFTGRGASPRAGGGAGCSGARCPVRWSRLCHGVMCAAMAVVLLAMV
jgi:Domain of unknown function (DUF5134)